MIIVLVRTIIIYILVLFVIRIMGKSELSSMEPFQLVVTLMIADLAVLPIESIESSLFNGVSALIALLFVQVFVSFITLKSVKLRALICGRPSVLIDKGNINEKEMKHLRISMLELTEQLRANGYPSVSDVDFAVLETNGDLSVILKADKRPLTPEDLNIKQVQTYMPVPIVVDGFLYDAALAESGLSMDFFEFEMRRNHLDHLNEILFCYLDEKKKFIFYKKHKEGDQK